MNMPRSDKVPRDNSGFRQSQLVARFWLACVWLTIGVTGFVIATGPMVRADKTIFDALQRLRGPEADTLMVAVTELGDTFVVTCVTLALMAWFGAQRASFGAQRAWPTAMYLGAAVGGASLLNTAIKVFAQRARPVADLYTGWSAFSFPSGHATVNAVLYGFLGFLLARQLRPAGRVAVGLVLLAFVAAVIFSRLYLGAHWFSDVAGSLLVAVPWTILLATSYASRQRPMLNLRAVVLVACVMLALAGGLHIWQRHALDMARYGAPFQGAENLNHP